MFFAINVWRRKEGSEKWRENGRGEGIERERKFLSESVRLRGQNVITYKQPKPCELRNS